MAIPIEEILAGADGDGIKAVPLAEGGKEWLEYLETNESADICHHCAWGNIFADTFGLDSWLILHRTDGRIDGGLPLVYFNQKITGRAIISMPFLNYGGILADNDEVKSAILDTARKLMICILANYLELRHTGQGVNNLADKTRQNRSTFRLDINRPADEIFKKLKKQLRTRIRKAGKQGIEYYQGQERLDHFYHLFATAMTEHGTPVMPKRFFASILKHLPDNSEMMIAYEDETPIGGKLLLKFKNRATMTWGCFPDKYKHLLANYYLTWELIEKSAGGAIEILDFGRSAIDSGGYIYKSNWGCDLIPIYVDYIASDPDRIPDLKPENAKFKMAISIWKKMPVGMAKIFGPRLARYFP